MQNKGPWWGWLCLWVVFVCVNCTGFIWLIFIPRWNENGFFKYLPAHFFISPTYSSSQPASQPVIHPSIQREERATCMYTYKPCPTPPIPTLPSPPLTYPSPNPALHSPCCLWPSLLANFIVRCTRQTICCCPRICCLSSMSLCLAGCSIKQHKMDPMTMYLTSTPVRKPSVTHPLFTHPSPFIHGSPSHW